VCLGDAGGLWYVTQTAAQQVLQQGRHVHACVATLAPLPPCVSVAVSAELAGSALHKQYGMTKEI
jgi:hypothetical protein